MISFGSRTRILAILLLAAGPVYAQGTGSSGSINGTVIDPSGAVIPRATVTAVESARGARFTAASDSQGLYRFTSLAPATYDVSVQASGFQGQTQKGIVVSVGETTTVDFHLKLASAGSVVEVTAAPPAVDTDRASQSNTITDEYITNLPIDRRDYLTFTLLLPGVSDSTRLADDQDFRVQQTPQSGLSFYGSNGRGNSITIDGGDTSGDSGGTRLTVGQDAVAEFQVNRSNYPADLGGGSGAAVNIVTKSGSDDFHGSIFGFFRNQGMDARDPFAFNQALAPGQVFNPLDPDIQATNTKNDLSRYQFGGNVGGPIVKGKTYFFVSFEGLRQDSENAVPLLTNTSSLRPTADEQTIINNLAANPAVVPCLNNPDGTVLSLPGPQCAGALTLGLTTSQVTGLTPGQTALNTYLIGQLESNGGLFDYDTRQYLVSGRIDHHVSDRDQLTFTYRFGHDREENPNVQSLNGFSAGNSIHTYDNTLQGAWFHQYSPVTQNELRAQFSYSDFDVIPNVAAQPGLQIFGFANNLGTNIFLPNFTILRRWDFADNVTMTRGRHTIRFGGGELLRGNHSESHTFFPGRFVFGPLPGALISPQLATTEINSLQAASFGLPQVYQQGFGNADYPAYTRPFTSLYIQDAFRVTPNFTLNYGLRYEIDNQYNPLNTYYKDFAPRVSFAWDPFHDHKTVIRGGYGIFYGPIDAQIPAVDLSLGVLNQNRTTVENQKGSSGVPGQVNNVVNTCGIGFPGVPIFPGSGSSPCTRFISIYVDPLNATGLPIANSATVFQNLFAGGQIQCTTPPPGASACITPGDVAPFGIFVANSGQLSPLTVLFSNPPDYRPPYAQQASLSIEREFFRGFTFSASFIYSHTSHLPVAIDTNLLNAPMTTVTLANGKTVSYRNWNTSAALDPVAALPPALVGGAGVAPCTPNPFACFVNPLIVQNNRYSSDASALYEGAILEAKYRYSQYVSVFANYTYSHAYDTSTDYNTDYGPQDPTNLALDRGPSEFDERNKVVVAGVFDSPWKNAILSGFEFAPIFNYHSGHPFNLLAGGEVNGNNHTTNERPIGAPRDSGLGDNYYDFDARLAWSHKVTERSTIKFTAEGFNIFNRTNYASVNNEVSPLYGFLPGFTGFKARGIVPNFTTVTPSTPLAYTSAFPKRQIQLGVRFSF